MVVKLGHQLIFTQLKQNAFVYVRLFYHSRLLMNPQLGLPSTTVQGVTKKQNPCNFRLDSNFLVYKLISLCTLYTV